MKHCFLTLTALLGFSFAFAGTHTVKIYDDASTPSFASIVDQDNNEFAPIGNMKKVTIDDGTTLTFTLNDEELMVYCLDDASGEPFASCVSGASITIDESFPAQFSIAADEPTATIVIRIPHACDIISVKIDGLSMDVNDYCKNGHIEIPVLYEGTVVELTSTEPIDWEGNDNISTSFTIEIEDVSAEDPFVNIGGHFIWDDTDENLEIVTGEQDITYTNRTIFAGMWNPICLPFDLTQADMEGLFGQQTVVQFEGATFSAGTGLVIECSYVTNGMEANTPYLVQPENDMQDILFQNINIEENFTPKTVEPAGSDIKFVGTIYRTQLHANDKTVLFIGSGNKVFYPNEDFKLKGFRAYFKLPEGTLSAPGRAGAPARFVIRNRQTPTGLNDNVTDIKASKKYMQDGRLVIENNGIRYNAQGLQMD